MQATPSWTLLTIILIVILLVSGLIYGLLNLFFSTTKKDPSGRSKASGLLTGLFLIAVSFFVFFIFLGLFYASVSHDFTVETQSTELIQPVPGEPSLNIHENDAHQIREPSPNTRVHPNTPQLRLRLDLFLLGPIILIGGAFCFAFYVFLASRKPAEPSSFRLRSIFWLLPIIGMWGLASWLYIGGVISSQGHYPLPWYSDSNLLLEHGGFEEENVLAWYSKESGPNILSTKATEIEGPPGAYPQWILDAQAYNNKTKVYYSPATFVLMGTGDSELAAVENALEKGVPNAINHFRLKHTTNKGPTTFPATLLKSNVTDLYAVKGTITTGLGDQYDHYRVWVRLSIGTNPKVPSYNYWKSNLMEDRMMSLVGFIGFLVFSFIVLTAYLRLNQRSERKFQNRLRLATLVVLIPVGLIACGILIRFV